MSDLQSRRPEVLAAAIPAAAILPTDLPVRQKREKRAVKLDGWTRALRTSVGVLVFLGVWTCLSVYILPADLYAWYGERTFGVELMRHNLTSHHWLADLTHRLVGVVYLGLAMFQFSPYSRRHPRAHRWTGRVFMTMALLQSTSGLLMTRESFSGWSERMANIVFGVAFILTLLRALLLARRRSFKLHREWMIRAFAISLGVLTLRVIYGIIRYNMTMSFQDVLTVSTWLGYVVNLAVAEAWINYTRPGGAAKRANAGTAAVPGGS